ncbi:urea transporter [Psychromonas aquimarina]|uniref:urea transporter n=1 Tax=Psychromonas aquimarina TaxID=444919 RepID=UPI00146FA1C9|nr:urea transporter [Psychromonas aquimarina]
MKAFIYSVFSKVKPVLNSYSEIFFLQNFFSGLIILLITCINPHLGLSGLLAICSAYSFARFIGYHAEFLTTGYYTYNPLLVGLSIGYLFELSWLSVPFIAIAAVLTFILTLSLANIFYRLFGLQILSIPFVIVSSLIYLAASRFSNLYVNDIYTPVYLLTFPSDLLPLWLSGFLQALGAIIFLPSPAAGLLILLMIGFASRILLLLAVFGFLFGTALQGAFTGSYDMAVMDIAAFNYILIAMALGCVLNIPSPRSYVLAFIGVALATILLSSTDVFWSQYGIPVFTLPFIVITLGMTYVLGLLNYPLRPFIYKPTPEQTAEYFHTAQLRYPSAVTMHLPFSDEWMVSQGFDGQWTHKGLWRYAYDFVKTDNTGSTFHNDGKLLHDYFCFQKEVCSPVQGYVVNATDHFADNSIGIVDTINNWGNYIVIQDIRGFYVALCHLSQYKVFVKQGDWVEPYQVVGLCGNSGYSPQPHIHMQYQSSSYIASATIPFCFNGVIEQDTYRHHCVPPENTHLKPAYNHSYYMQVSNFILDDILHFNVKETGTDLGRIEFVTKMAIDGTFYLERHGSRLYLGRSDSCFYFYHLEGNDKYLKVLYQALPSLPFNYLEQAHWFDFIPVHFIGNKLQQVFSQWRQIMSNKSVTNNARYAFIDDHTIAGEIKPKFSQHTIKTKIVLDPYVKFTLIQAGDIQLISAGVKK